MIKLKNGSTIKTIKTTDNNIRGNRSKIMGFYCSACDIVHTDFPIDNMVFISHDVFVCRQGFEQVKKSLGE